MTSSFGMRQSQDIILGGNHSQMAALNMRALLADALLPMEESSKAILFVVNRNDIIIVQRKENISILSGFLYFVQDFFWRWGQGSLQEASQDPSHSGCKRRSTALMRSSTPQTCRMIWSSEWPRLCKLWQAHLWEKQPRPSWTWRSFLLFFFLLLPFR